MKSVIPAALLICCCSVSASLYTSSTLFLFKSLYNSKASNPTDTDTYQEFKQAIQHSDLYTVVKLLQKNSTPNKEDRKKLVELSGKVLSERNSKALKPYDTESWRTTKISGLICTLATVTTGLTKIYTTNDFYKTHHVYAPLPASIAFLSGTYFCKKLYDTYTNRLPKTAYSNAQSIDHLMHNLFNKKNN